MQAYLAEKYMSGPKADAILARTAPKKKKKRKAEQQASGSGSAMIIDTDGGWGDEGKDEEADDVAEAVIEKDRGFKKRRMAAAEGEGGSGWTTVQPPPWQLSDQSFGLMHHGRRSLALPRSPLY